ncbi:MULTISPECIES: hypothetical protein [Streptomyces violaceusniger group]|uniref:Uncharacterized protein n=2 Tax=Streptomyces rhizosphaericus TaxID=114699 RepID=A0ABP3ZCU5_9ACTN|nr:MULTISPECIES: hypothetical protein [Streptomyces violaceusniger group]
MTMTPAELEAQKETLELLNTEASSRLTRQSESLAKAGFTRIGTADRDTETGTVPFELYALESGA